MVRRNRYQVRKTLLFGGTTMSLVGRCYLAILPAIPYIDWWIVTVLGNLVRL